MHGRMPGRLHLSRASACLLHPARRVCRLRASRSAPVEAIYYEDDLPGKWADYYKANVEFFDDLGSPGGASKVGVLKKDHPLVAVLFPRAAARAEWLARR